MLKKFKNEATNTEFSVEIFPISDDNNMLSHVVNVKENDVHGKPIKLTTSVYRIPTGLDYINDPKLMALCNQKDNFDRTYGSQFTIPKNVIKEDPYIIDKCSMQNEKNALAYYHEKIQQCLDQGFVELPSLKDKISHSISSIKDKFLNKDNDSSVTLKNK